MPVIKGPGKQVTRTTETGSAIIPAGMYDRQFAAYDSLGRQVASLGEEFADAGLRLEMAERQDEIVAGELYFDSEFNKFYPGLLNDPQYADRPKKFKKWANELSAKYLAGVRHPGARNELAERFANTINSKERVLIAESAQLKNAEIRSRIPSLIAKYVNEAAMVPLGDVPKVKKILAEHLNKFRATGAIYSGHVDAYLSQFDSEVGEVREAKIFAGAAENLKQFTDRKQAIDYIDNVLVHALSREQRNDLMAITNRRFDGIEAQAKLKEETAKAKIEEEVADIGRTGNVDLVAEKLDQAFTDRLLFSDGEKVEEWRDKILKRTAAAANAIKQNQKNPYTTVTDWQAYMEQYKKCWESPETVKHSDCYGPVGDKWGKTHADEMWNLATGSEDDPLKSPQAKMYLQGLNDLYMKAQKIETAEDWDRANRALIGYIRNNPDATPKQLSEFYNGLIEPYMRGWWSKNIDDFLSDLGWVKAKVLGRPREAGKATKGKKPESISDTLLNIEPADIDGFRFEVKRISANDKELARKYFEKYKNKWPEVFE